jgi:hypothetical protein
MSGKTELTLRLENPNSGVCAFDIAMKVIDDSVRDVDAPM